MVAENHLDYNRMQELFKQAVGAHMANLNYTSLDNIINRPWFNAIYTSWSNNNRLERCAHKCVVDNTPVTQIYSYIKVVTN